MAREQNRKLQLFECCLLHGRNKFLDPQRSRSRASLAASRDVNVSLQAETVHMEHCLRDDHYHTITCKGLDS